MIINPFQAGVTRCYFCGKVFPKCPTVYAYRSKHGQPFIFCQKCHRARYITKTEADKIEQSCRTEPVVVGSVTEAAKIHRARASSAVGKVREQAVVPVLVKAGARTVPMVAKVGTEVLPVVIRAGAKTAIGIAKLGGKSIMVVGRALTGVRRASAVSPLALPEYRTRSLISTDTFPTLSRDGMPLVGSVTEMVTVANPRKRIKVILLK